MGKGSPLVVSLPNHTGGSERPTVVMPANAGIQRGEGARLGAMGGASSS